MRRAALLKAKALVHSLSLAVCAPATLLNAPLIEFVPVPPVDHVSYTHLRVWAHTLGQLCGIYISSRAWPIGSLSSPQIPSRLATHRVYYHILVMQRLVQGIGSTHTTMHWMIPCCLTLKVTSRKTFFMLKCFVRVGRYSRFSPVSHILVVSCFSPIPNLFIAGFSRFRRFDWDTAQTEGQIIGAAGCRSCPNAHLPFSPQLRMN